MMGVWSAWLTGDPEELSSAYGVLGSPYTDFFNLPDIHTGHQSQQAGGVVGTIARFFWGRPSVTGRRRARLHVPMAADLATASADLLFSEPPQFIVDDGEDDLPTPQVSQGKTVKVQTPAEKRVDDVLNDGGFHADMVEAAEIVAGLGGGWLRLVWDMDVADYVMIDSVNADAAIGEWRWGVLRAVTFFTEYPQGSSDREVIRHLERHEPGRILHGLYDGTDKTLGEVMALEDHPSTAPYATLVDADGAIPTGVDGLTAAYIANMRPQRRWRKVEQLANLGRSDFDGIEPLMDALDETYTSWMRDVRLGKGRILVPEFMLDNLGKGKGAAWDEDKEIYSALAIAPTDAAQQAITIQQFDIRVDQHKRTAADLVDHIMRAAGYSPGTFGLNDEGGVATATEVNARERTSARTRDKKCRYWSQALEPLLDTWLQLDALLFSTGAVGDVDVKWADTSQPDMLSLSTTIETLNRAVAVSYKTKVEMLHPDWDEKEIAEEVQAIIDQEGMLLPTLPTYATGDGGNGNGSGAVPAPAGGTTS